MAEADIYDALSTGVAALGSRIYPLKLPQNVVYPAVVQQRISTIRHSAFGRDVPLVEPVIQIDVYSHQSAGAGVFYSLLDEVRRALQRYRGGTVSDTYIDAERDDYEENTELFRKSFDIRPWYRET